MGQVLVSVSWRRLFGVIGEQDTGNTLLFCLLFLFAGLAILLDWFQSEMPQPWRQEGATQVSGVLREQITKKCRFLLLEVEAWVGWGPRDR